jgi:Ca2+-binding EF-hand superfamily protein
MNIEFVLSFFLFFFFFCRLNYTWIDIGTPNVSFLIVFQCFNKDGDGKISALDLGHRLGLVGSGDDLFLQEAKSAVEAFDEDGFLGLEDFVEREAFTA